MKVKVNYIYPAIMAALLAGCASKEVIIIETTPLYVSPVVFERCYVIDHTRKEPAGRAMNEAGDEYYFHTECNLHRFIDYAQIAIDLDKSYLSDRNLPGWLRVTDEDIPSESCEYGPYKNVPGVDPCPKDPTLRKVWVK